ncbi:hypothetical protein RKLH11_3890 [Rhodobacteraceae bacterium KLH11]|nr:hypothetical protein RKLH11_3890 [Rhodobacteraceae bacterium KLH11]
MNFRVIPSLAPPRARQFSDVLNWSGLLAPGILGCKDGSFVCGWEVTGLDTESLEPEEMQVRLEQLAHGFSGFGDEECFWIQLDRRPFAGLQQNGDPSPYPALNILEAEARSLLSADGTLYENTIHLLYQWRPADPGIPLEQGLEGFAQACRTVEIRLGMVFGLRRLGLQTEEDLDRRVDRFDELAGLLASALTGSVQRFRIPRNLQYMFLDKWLGVDFERDPESGLPRIEGCPAVILTLEGVPKACPRGVLEVLETYGLEFRWTTRLSSMSPRTARKHLRKDEKVWAQNAADPVAQIVDGGGGRRDRYAEEMALGAEEMATDVNRGEAVGMYLSTLTLIGGRYTTPEELQAAAEEIEAVLVNAGFKVRYEREAALELYLASLPGHAHRVLRDTMMPVSDFVELIPLRTSWKGEVHNPSPLFPSNSPALTWARSMTGELFHFNLHVDDVGHTFMFGPTGGGKSVLLGLLSAHWLKYPDARVIYFDKGYSSRHLVNVFEGSFTSFGGETGRGVAPLMHLRELGLEWGVDWVGEMAKLSGVSLTPALRDEIRAGLSNALKTGFLTLSELQTYLQNPELQSAIRRFSRNGGSGLLDDDDVSLDWENLTVFEVDELFQQNEDMALLALDYIFAQVERRFDGKPTLLVLDEAHAFLGHSIFASRIRRWLKEARRSNVTVLMATQSLSDLTMSDLADVLLESCQTQIFLPNPKARTEKVRKQYLTLGMTKAQIDLIASLTPKRDYYLVKPSGQRVVEFLLGPLALSLLGKTSKEQSILAGQLHKESPDYWREEVQDILDRHYQGDSSS